MTSKKVKECSSCGQGFTEDNNPVGIAIPTSKCLYGIHDGPIIRIIVAPPGNTNNRGEM